MADGGVTIKEIRAKFTADIGDYRKKMQALSDSIAGIDGKLEGIKRKAQTAMESPSKSTQKLGRDLNASVTALQKGQQQFETLTRAGEQTAAKMEKVRHKMEEAANAYQAIKKAAASGIDLSTPLQKQADAAKARLAELDARIDALNRNIQSAGNYGLAFDGNELLSIDMAKARIKELAQEAGKADEKFQQLSQAISNIGTENLEFANEKGLKRLEKQIESSGERLEQLGSKLSRVGQQAQDVTEKVQQNSQAFRQQAKSLSRASILCNALISAGDRLGKGLSVVKNRIANIGNSSGSSTKKMEGLLRSIRRISIVSLGLRLARASSGMGELQSAVTRYMDTNDAAAASINRLRNGLTNALAPAINLCVNLLSKLMPYLIGIVDAVASLITNIFGEGWVSVSTGAGAAADATKNVADSTKDAAKAQKEYNKLVAGFDEIEKLDKQSNDSGSGGSGGSGGKAKQDKAEGTEGIAGKLPKWLESLIHDIDGLLEKGNFYGIGARISETLNNATKAVDDWFNNVLRPKGVLWAGRFADVFNGLVEGYDWGLLGTTISDGLLACIDIAGTFIRNARFESLGKGIATGVNNAIKRISESDINFGSVLADLLNAGIRGLYGLVSTIKWSQIGTFIANNVNKFFKTVDWKKAGRTAGKLIAGLTEMLATAIRRIDKSKIVEAFSTFLENAGISKSLVLEIALLFTISKAVKIASAICGAIGLGATAAMSGIAGIALPVTLVLGTVMAAQGFSGILQENVNNALKKAGYDPKKDFNSNGTKKGHEKWYNSKVRIDIGDVDMSGTRQAQQRKIYTEGAKRRLSNQSGASRRFATNNGKLAAGGAQRRTSNMGGKVAENTQKATEKNAKTSSDGWSWLKRAASSASTVARGTSAKIKTVSTINQTGKNTQTVGVKLAQDGWGSVGDWVQEHIGNPVAKAVGLGQDKWESVSGWVKDHLGGGVSKAIGLGKDGWSLVSSWVKENLGGGVSKAIDLVRDKWSSVKDWVNDHTGGGVSKLVSLAKSGWSTVSSWVSSGRTSVQAKVSLVKQGWKTLSGFIGSFTKRIGLKLSWSHVTGWKATVGKVLFGSPKWPSLKFAARGGIVNGATLFGNTVVGEAGKEAIIPLERNTEWTGQVAKLLAQHLYDLPQPIAPSAYSAGNTISGSDVAELVSLLRAIRSDVAAVKQGGGGTVTVNTNLDGRRIAQSTIDYINGQAKATGVNPLAAYM